MADKKTPRVKMRVGNIQASVWRNKYKGQNGKADFEVDTITIQRSWKDGEEWKAESLNIRKNDLVKLSLITQKLIEDQFLNQDDKEAESITLP